MPEGPEKQRSGSKASYKSQRRANENLRVFIVGAIVLAIGTLGLISWGVYESDSASATATHQAYKNIQATSDFLSFCNAIDRLNLNNIHPQPTPFNCPNY